jgi:hypothetical protein
MCPRTSGQWAPGVTPLAVQLLPRAKRARGAAGCRTEKVVGAIFGWLVPAGPCPAPCPVHRAPALPVPHATVPAPSPVLLSVLYNYEFVPHCTTTGCPGVTPQRPFGDNQHPPFERYELLRRFIVWDYSWSVVRPGESGCACRLRPCAKSDTCPHVCRAPARCMCAVPLPPFTPAVFLPPSREATWVRRGAGPLGFAATPVSAAQRRRCGFSAANATQCEQRCCVRPVTPVSPLRVLSGRTSWLFGSWASRQRTCPLGLRETLRRLLPRQTPLRTLMCYFSVRHDRLLFSAAALPVVLRTLRPFTPSMWCRLSQCSAPSPLLCVRVCSRTGHVTPSRRVVMQSAMKAGLGVVTWPSGTVTGGRLSALVHRAKVLLRGTHPPHAGTHLHPPASVHPLLQACTPACKRVSVRAPSVAGCAVPICVW